MKPTLNSEQQSPTTACVCLLDQRLHQRHNREVPSALLIHTQLIIMSRQKAVKQSIQGTLAAFRCKWLAGSSLGFETSRHRIIDPIEIFVTESSRKQKRRRRRRRSRDSYQPCSFFFISPLNSTSFLLSLVPRPLLPTIPSHKRYPLNNSTPSHAPKKIPPLCISNRVSLSRAGGGGKGTLQAGK